MAGGDVTLRADGATVRVRGIGRVIDRLDAAAGAIADQSAPMGRIGAAIERTASASTPRLSGRLAGTLRARATSDGVVVRLGGSSAPYAPPIHYGWRARNISPSPSLRDALTRHGDDAVNVVEQHVGRVLSRFQLT